MASLSVYHTLRYAGVDLSSFPQKYDMYVEKRSSGTARYHSRTNCYGRRRYNDISGAQLTEVAKVSASSACPECFDTPFSKWPEWSELVSASRAIGDDAAKALKLKAPKTENLSRYVSLLMQAEQSVASLRFNNDTVDTIMLAWREGLKKKIRSFQQKGTSPAELSRITRALFRHAASASPARYRAGEAFQTHTAFSRVAYAEVYKESEKIPAIALKWAKSTDTATAAAVATSALAATGALRSLPQITHLTLPEDSDHRRVNEVLKEMWDKELQAVAHNLAKSWETKAAAYQNDTSRTLLAIHAEALDGSVYSASHLTDKEALAAVGAYTHSVKNQYTIVLCPTGVATALLHLHNNSDYQRGDVRSTALEETDTDDVITTCLGLFEPAGGGEFSNLSSCLETARALS